MKNIIFTLTTLFLLISAFLAIPLKAQSILDTIHQLKTVEIKANRHFKQQLAGMKQRRVDTLVIADKVNLSLSGLLSENTSVFIKNYGRGALATASFRGTASSHTKVNWNGMELTSPMTGMADFSLIPVYIIDDVKLEFGAASLSKQSGGLGGLVDISNQVDFKNETKLKFIQGTGSYSTFEEFLGFTAGNKKFQSKTRMYYNYSRNDFTFVNRGIGTIDPVTGKVVNPVDTNYRADYRISGLLQEFYYQPNSENILSLKYWGQKADRSIPRATSFEGPDNTNLNRQTDVNHSVIADWKRSGKLFYFTLRSGYTDKNLNYNQKNFISGQGEIPVVYSKSSIKSFFNSFTFNKKITGNFELDFDIHFNHHQVNTIDTVIKSGYNQNRSEASVMFSLSKSIADRLNIKALLRNEIIENEQPALIPYFGFDLRLIREKDLFIRGNIARNLNYPSLNDLYWQPGGNPELEPEEGISYELGLEHVHKHKGLMLSTALTAYYNDINNWIIWLPSFKGFWVPENIKKVISKGIEVDVSLRGSLFGIDYNLAGNYAYTSSVNRGSKIIWGDQSYNKQLPYVPLHSGNVFGSFSWRSFSLAYQFNSYSKRYTTTSNDLSSRNYIYAYYMNSLSLGKKFRWKKVSLSTQLKIYNLFNETYHSVLYRPMPGRNFMLLIMIEI